MSARASSGHPDQPRDVAPRSSIDGNTESMIRDQGVAPNPDRIAAGWERRFVADRARALEAMELYRELGFEVLADPVAPEELRGDCESCRLLLQLQFRTIYTRKPPRNAAARGTKAGGTARRRGKEDGIA